MAVEAHSHPFLIHLPTDHTDVLTNLQTACNLHWDTDLTHALQYTSLGRIRQHTRHHWWTYSLLPQSCHQHCLHHTHNWIQPPKLTPTQAGHDRQPSLPLVPYTTMHLRTPPIACVLVTTPTTWHSSTHCHLSNSADQQ